MIPSGRRYFGWVLIGFPVLLLLVALVVLVQAKAFLKSDRFRTFLGDKVSETVHARGGFRTLEWAGSSFYSDGFTANGNPGAALENIDAQQVRAAVNLRGLWEKKWQVEGVEVERLLLVPATKEEKNSAGPTVRKSPGERKETAQPSGHFLASWLPNRVEVERVTIANFKLDGRNLETPFAIDGMKIEGKPDGGAWVLDASSGTLTAPKLPALTLGEASVRYAENTVFINHADWLVNGGGTLKLNGEIPQDNAKPTDLTVKVAGVPAATVLPKDWRARLFGTMAADFHVVATGGDWKATGPVSITDGRLEALPVLEQVALFTRTQRFRQLNLDIVQADLSIEKGRVTATNLNAESPGLLRIRGGFVVENNQMQGDFLVGVTPASLRYIPGSQTKIFTTERDGYLWTTMKVTGAVNHLHEDLSERLALAAGQELIDSIQKDPSKLKDTLKDAAQSLFDLLGK